MRCEQPLLFFLARFFVRVLLLSYFYQPAETGTHSWQPGRVGCHKPEMDEIKLEKLEDFSIFVCLLLISESTLFVCGYVFVCECGYVSMCACASACVLIFSISHQQSSLTVRSSHPHNPLDSSTRRSTIPGTSSRHRQRKTPDFCLNTHNSWALLLFWHILPACLVL